MCTYVLMVYPICWEEISRKPAGTLKCLLEYDFPFLLLLGYELVPWRVLKLIIYQYVDSGDMQDTRLGSTYHNGIV